VKIAARKLRAEWWKGKQHISIILSGKLLTAFTDAQIILILHFWASWKH
jgi:hypothetical protein